MRLSKVLILAINNLPLFIKNLFLSFLILSIFVAVLAVGLNVPVSDNVAVELSESGKNILYSFFSPSDNFMSFNLAIKDFSAKIRGILPEGLNALYEFPSLSLVFIIIIVFLWKFVNGLSDMAVLKSVNDFMTTSRRRLFAWHYFKFFGRACLFQLGYLGITFFIDIVAVMAVIGAYSVFFIFLGFYGSVGGILFFIVIYSLRLSLFSYWQTAVAVDNMKIREGLRHGISSVVKNFLPNFIFTLTIVTAVFTGVFASLYYLSNIYGLMLVSAMGVLSNYLLKCMSMVYYYDASGKSYFTYKLEITNE